MSDKSHKAIAIFATAVFVGSVLWYHNNTQSADMTATSTNGSVAQTLPRGDADSSVDTIRALKQNAKQAAQAASAARTELSEYQAATKTEIETLKNTIAIQSTEAKAAVQQGMTELKSEFSNFSALLKGQLQQVPPSVPTVAQTGGEQWVTIPPINQAVSVGARINTAVENVSAFSNIEESNGYSVNNGFLLTETTIADASNLSVNQSGKVPVATIPENSILLNGITLSTLIGRIPKGGAVVDPFEFTVMTGNKNLTSQLHDIPFLDNAIWRGTTTGDSVLDCIRGKVLSVTFVFTDGTILTDHSGTEDRPLAEITTPTGSNCVPGLYVTNTPEYLAMLGAAGGIAGLGEAISNNETITSITTSGSIIETVDGDAGKFFAGKALSEAAQQAARIIEQEYNSSFASVVKGSGQPINMIATKQIEIDYDVNGRKVSYVNPEDYDE